MHCLILPGPIFRDLQTNGLFILILERMPAKLVRYGVAG